jgi:hypothetical protein
LAGDNGDYVEEDCLISDFGCSISDLFFPRKRRLRHRPCWSFALVGVVSIVVNPSIPPETEVWGRKAQQKGLQKFTQFEVFKH